MFCRKCSRALPEDAVFCCYCGIRQEPAKPKRRKRANGTGTTFRYRGGYAAELTVGWEVKDGKPCRKIKRLTGFRTTKEAEDALASMRAGLQIAEAERHHARILTKTVSELWESYRTSELPKRGESTRTAYEIAYRKRIKGTIGDKPIDVVTLDDLNGIVASCTYDPAKDVRDLMSILFQRAIVDKLTTVNPTKLMTMPEQSGNEVVPWLPSEVSSLWRAWGDGERAAGYSLLMIHSGMMTGELLKLKEDMIDWDARQIVGCGLKTKKRKELPIHFPDIMEPILRELCATKCGKRGAQGYIVDVCENVFYKRFADLKARYGIRTEVIPYSSRHSTGTELALLGVPPAVIIDIMRQKNYTTTLRHYTKIPAEALLSALNAMSEQDRLASGSPAHDSHSDSSD